jgi:hypothetical protein
MRKHTGMTNRQIGDLFGRVSYSAVAKARERFTAQLSRDRSLRRTIQEITARLSHINGLLPKSARLQVEPKLICFKDVRRYKSKLATEWARAGGSLRQGRIVAPLIVQGEARPCSRGVQTTGRPPDTEGR